MAALARFRTFVGIAKETTEGTAATATDYIPVTVDPKSSDKLMLIDDKSYRGSAVESYAKIAGMKTGSMDVSGNVNLHSIGYMIQSILPDLTVTGASAPFTTTFASLNSSAGQPKSYTLVDFDGDVARAFSGAHMDSLSIKFKADGLLEFTSKAMTWGSTTVSTPTPSYSTLLPVAAYTGVIKVGGTPITNVQDCQIDLKRKCEYIQTVNNTQNPFQVFSGAIVVTGKFTAVLLASDPMLSAYLSNTAQNLTFTFTQGVNSLAIQATTVVYTKADVQRGKDFVELSVDFEAVGNTTDAGASAGYSPCKVTLVNDAPAATYS